MNYFLLFLHLLVIYLTIITSINSTEHDPLTFNPNTLEIHNVSEENSNLSDCQPCAVACPANTDPERNFENIYSRYRSLFIQQFIAVLQEQNPIRLKCEKGYELTVLVHSKNGSKFVEFGYQVYFEKSKFQNEGIVSNDFNEFESVVVNESTFERVYSWQKNNLTAPWGERKTEIKKWGFLWIPKIEIRYSFSLWTLKSLKYKVSAIEPDQHKLTCYNHNLYGTWYNMNYHLNKLYAYDNQFMIFTKVKIPEGSCRPNNQPGECVKKHNLVLPYQFQASSPNTISCSNMTSIPLWNDVPDQLMHRMQMFLIAIAQVLGKQHELIVLPGVLGQLTLPSVEDSKPVKIYLNSQDKKVPVPKTIYKLVRHKTHKCDEKQMELCWFDVLIVIHNYPTITSDERLCPIDECEKMGWDNIQYLDSDNSIEDKSPFVYCCELNKNTAKSIGFPLGKTRSAPLNLKNFSVYDHNQGRHQVVTILNLVQERFKNLTHVEVEDEEIH